MDVILIVVVVVLLLIIVFVVRRNKSPAGKRPDSGRPKSVSGDLSFHAVSINYAPGACKAAQEMADRRFLSNAAPRLPLPECDVLECNCRFTHHKDRRERDDRRNPYMSNFGGIGAGTKKKEQRDRDDRRKKSKKDL